MKSLRRLIVGIVAFGFLGNSLAADTIIKPKKSIEAKSQIEQLSTYPAPFDFKGIPLGITPSEFKALEGKAPEHDVYLKPSYTLVRRKSWPVCTGDPKPEFVSIAVYGIIKQLGGAKCVWVHTNGAYQDVEAAEKILGGMTVSSYEYTFVKRDPSDAEPLLYLITLLPHVNGYDGIVEGLTKKFGKPTRVSHEMVQNRMGAQYENETTSWENKISRVTVTKYAGTLEQSFVIFQLNELADKVSQAEKAEKESKGPGI